MFQVVSYYSNSKLEDKQYQQKTSPKNYKTVIKVFAYLWLALLGFEQPDSQNSKYCFTQQC